MAAQGVGPGPGSAAPPGLEAARQKLALRRKKVLSTEEMELYELAQAAGGAIDPDVFKEKQRQRCPRGSIGPGGTQQPRRIQPEDATPAQRYQAAQGGRAWEEPYTGQHLGWGRDLLHLCPQQRLHVTSFN
ncbi:mitotic-spindle organizing protein 2B isoform 3 [Homo sapiens]|nr:mitotic-spindle organizing protein 2B isoform 3 [Homo sapiens]|eukprot:NP_001317213.1 mitotic-spindle organizing protein 2B isoform 3 [Homo sapiens]